MRTTGSWVAMGALAVAVLGGCKARDNNAAMTGNTAVPPAATPVPAESAAGQPGVAPGTAASAALADPQIAQVALSASIKYHRPARGRLTAVARKSREDDRTSTFAVMVYSGSDLVAEFEGIGFKLKK